MSTTALKLTALVFMTADHIGRFIPGAPFFLRIIGRIAAPVFLFCSRWGYDCTRNRKSYLTRLYVFSLVTGVMNFALNTLYPAAYHRAGGNIFSTIFVILMYIWRIEKGEREKLLYGLLHLASWGIHGVLTSYGAENLLCITDALVPSIFVCEGGTMLFIMGILFYYSKQDKALLHRNYLVFCIVYTAVTVFSALPAVTGIQLTLWDILFRYYIQWLQVLALPFILAYNGRKGAGLRWLFYFYYPLHTLVLFLAGNALI